MNSGNLHIEIPFATVPGHNTSHNYIYHYDNQGWYYHTFPLPGGGVEAIPQPEVGNGIQWRIPRPMTFLVTRSATDADCPSSTGAVYSNIILQEPDGTKHQFPFEYGPVGFSCGGDYSFSQYAMDGSGWRMDIEHGAVVRAVRKDGMQVIFDTSNGNGKEPISIVSSNGDMVSRSTDSLGRPLPSMTDDYSPGQRTFTYTDSSGQPQAINITRTPVTTSTHLCGESPYMCKDGSGGIFYQPTTIELPNHLKYQFTYEQDQLGEPNSVTLPTGGQISWMWGATAAGGRKVTSRTITSDGNSATWIYSWGSPNARDQNFNWQNSMVDPQGNETVYTCGSSNTGWGSSKACQIEKVQYYAGRAADGHVLKTVVSEYSQNPGFLSDRLVAENTILNDLNLVSRIETDWDAVEAEPNSNIWASWQNPLERREYDYGVGAPGKLIRRTRYTYLHLDNQAYKNLNLADLVTSETVYDGDGNIVSQTHMGYDETPLIQTSGAPNHDYTNFSANNTIRGNLTSIGHWRSSDGMWLTTKNAFDDLGNLRSTTDPQGHVTTYSYDDKWANAVCVPSGVNTQGYLTKVTNALNQSTETSYYPCTGRTSSHRDQNDINAKRSGTTYIFDGMNRPLTIGNPDGGSTSFDYNGDALPLKATKTELATPNPNVVTSIVYDGMGRVAQTSLDSDPEGVVYTDTTYDSMSRAASVSNPYRSSSDATYGLTRYDYDPLGRQTKVTRPDGSAATTSYSGSCTTNVDEVGRSRGSCWDGLGRLVEVDEPGGSGSPALPGSGSGVVSGAEQSTQVLVQAALFGSGSVQLSGVPQWKTVTNASTGGTSSVTINGSEQQYPAGVNPGVATITIGGTEQPAAQVVAAIPGTGSVSINGAVQSKQVQTQVVTSGSGSFTVSGDEASRVIQQVCGAKPNQHLCPQTFWDSGTVTLTVNGFIASVSYSQGSTASSLASSLLSQLNGPGSPVTASLSGNTISMTSYATGSAANYALSSSAATTDPVHFSGASFQATPSGSSLTGGQDAAYITVYDSGTAAITVNGHSSPPPGSQPVAWGEGSTPASVAIALASAVNADAAAFANATASGNVVMLSTRNAGAGSNYLLSSSLTFDAGNFSGPSFTSGNSGPSLTGGRDAVYVYDSGSVTATVNGHDDRVAWQNGSTATTIASGLSQAINADPGASVTATSAGNVVSLTAKIKGSVSNYSLVASSAYDTQHFSQPSFSATSSGAALTGGWPDAQAIDKGTMTVTINGHDYVANWGQTSTSLSIASDLASKINDPAVNASLSGNVIYLDLKQPGAAYTISTAYTYDSANFAQASFNRANAISDYGIATITVAGDSASVPWAGRSTASGIATDLTSKIQGDPSAVVSATATGGSISLKAKQPGIAGNYNLSASSSFDSANFTAGSLAATASGATLIGGLDAVYKTVFDTGVVSLAVNGFQASVPYQQDSTASSIAAALASQFNASHSASPIAALATDSSLGLASREPGANTNYPLSPSFSSSQPGLFPQPSFVLGMSGPSLTGGTDQTFDSSSPSVTRYAYDALGNLTCVVQKGQDTTAFTNCSSAPATWRPRSFVYDSLSQLTSAHNPESGTIEYAYDDDGNVISKKDARGNTVSYGPIDALHRVTKKTYSPGSPIDLPVSYFYDQAAYSGLTITNGIGRRTGMSDASGASAWSYDPMGRTSAEQQTINGTSSITKSSSYTYDLAGNVRNLTYPDGEVVVFGYNGAGRPSSAIDNDLGINFATQATYTAGGQLTGVIYGSSGGGTGITIANTYNQRQQPVSLSAASPTQSIFSLNYDFHVGHGDNGNVYQITNNRDDDRTQHFSYDGLNRIQSAWTSGPKWGETFVIDAWGNLTNRQPVPGKTYYEKLEASATVANQLTGPGLEHDENGNMTSDNGGKYLYDAENRISSTSGATFTYNGDGTRVMKSDGVIDWGPGPLSRSDLAGNITRNFVFFGGQRIARRVIPANTIDYMFSDHLGSLGVMTDAAGKIEGESEYYPFGGEQVISGGLTAYKFTGKERDSDGLDYFGARHYSSAMGRFMSPDWSAVPWAVPYADVSNPQTLNLYGYVGNNPLRFRDVDGHMHRECAPDTMTKGPAGEVTVQEGECHNVPDWYDNLLSRVMRTGAALSAAVIRWGKLGGPLHRAGVDRIARTLERSGWRAAKEVQIRTPNGAKSSRWVDVVGYNDKTGEVKMFQVGRQNLDGSPVSREVQALDDIEGATGIRPQFEPYNVGEPRFGMNPEIFGDMRVTSPVGGEVPTGEEMPDIPVIPE